jgi:c-di-GMP-binding flagellar brake protein YcgR
MLRIGSKRPGKGIARMEQRRRHHRVEVRLPVYCQMTSQEGRTFSILGKAWDLSLSGMRICLGAAFDPPSPHLVYDLHLPAPFARLCGSGAVRWTRWDPDAKRTSFGLEFLSLTDKQRTDLGTIVTELTRPATA